MRREIMLKKELIRNAISVIVATVIAMPLIVGCGSSTAEVAETVEQPAAEEVVTEVVQEEVPTADKAETTQAESVFKKGVYVNYAKDAENPPKTYFYVFEDDTYGYTADGEKDGIGVPFATEIKDGNVAFSFGGADGDWDSFIVSSTDNGMITGHFESAADRELVFEPVAGVDPATFEAENYVNGPENSVYHDANGWSVKYDATKFTVNQNGPEVFFVYQGESAGTNMITATYTVENKAEAAIKELAKPYGDNVSVFDGSFPGHDDIKAYWMSVPVDAEGSGSYTTAIGRDYMDGALILRIDGHMGNDEDQNMTVYDDIAAVMESITFEG